MRTHVGTKAWNLVSDGTPLVVMGRSLAKRGLEKEDWKRGTFRLPRCPRSFLDSNSESNPTWQNCDRIREYSKCHDLISIPFSLHSGRCLIMYTCIVLEPATTFDQTDYWWTQLIVLYCVWQLNLSFWACVCGLRPANRSRPRNQTLYSGPEYKTINHWRVFTGLYPPVVPLLDHLLGLSVGSSSTTL